MKIHFSVLSLPKPKHSHWSCTIVFHLHEKYPRYLLTNKWTTPEVSIYINLWQIMRFSIFKVHPFSWNGLCATLNRAVRANCGHVIFGHCCTYRQLFWSILFHKKRHKETLFFETKYCKGELLSNIRARSRKTFFLFVVHTEIDLFLNAKSSLCLLIAAVFSNVPSSKFMNVFLIENDILVHAVSQSLEECWYNRPVRADGSPTHSWDMGPQTKANMSSAGM